MMCIAQAEAITQGSEVQKSFGPRTPVPTQVTSTTTAASRQFA